MTEDLTSDLTSRLGEVSCASLVDAMQRRHPHRAHILPMVGPDPDRPLFGPAATMTFLPHRSDLESHDFADLFYRAVGSHPAGQVLVMSSGGYPDASHAGGTKLSRLQNHGLAGVLCDGRLRDFTQLADYDVATWCRGEATRWGGDTVMPYAAGELVEIAGVCVVPGDYVYVDASGGVVIPAADVQQVFDEAVRVEAEDARSAEAIRDERPDAPERGAI